MQGVVRVVIGTPKDPKETRSGFAETLAEALNFKLRNDGENTVHLSFNALRLRFAGATRSFPL